MSHPNTVKHPAAIAAKLVKAINREGKVKEIVNIGRLVDQMGVLNAQIDKLKEQHEDLRKQLIASELSEIDGELFRATVSRTNPNIVDWKTVAKKLKASKKLIAAHTTCKPKITVKVVSR